MYAMAYSCLVLRKPFLAALRSTLQHEQVLCYLQLQVHTLLVSASFLAVLSREIVIATRTLLSVNFNRSPEIVLVQPRLLPCLSLYYNQFCQAFLLRISCSVNAERLQTSLVRSPHLSSQFESLATATMVKQRMTTADVAGEVACLRQRVLGMRVANLYDLNSKVVLAEFCIRLIQDC